MNNLFGKYSKPLFLKQLEELSEKEEKSWVHPCFYLDYDICYSITPFDAVPFARTGGDGEHYCFLTDFGNVKNLESAPIILVQPGSNYIKFIAPNLKTFVSILISIPIEPIYLDFFDSKKNILLSDLLSEKYSVLSRNEIDKISDLAFKIRQSKITISTSDGLGIIYPLDDRKLNIFDYKIENAEKIKNFLSFANEPEKLKFYRDATQNYILGKSFDNEITEAIISQLKDDGYKKAARLIELKY